MSALSDNETAGHTTPNTNSVCKQAAEDGGYYYNGYYYPAPSPPQAVAAAAAVSKWQHGKPVAITDMATAGGGRGGSPSGGGTGSVDDQSATSTEVEMDFDDAIENGALQTRAYDREESLSPRARFYEGTQLTCFPSANLQILTPEAHVSAKDDGEVPVLLWAPSPCVNNPLYQGFGFAENNIANELDDELVLRSPHGLRELAAAGAAARDQWFSGSCKA